MPDKEVKKIIAKTFNDLASALVSGEYSQKPVISITAIGSEHGEQNIIDAAVIAAKNGVRPVVIGSQDYEAAFPFITVDNQEAAHKKMEDMLNNNEIAGAVTMHYPFPIGVSTVGRVITPAFGKEMFIATTTGTASGDRVEGMIKNAIYGIITARACGVQNPTVGIMNVDGARQVEIALLKLKENGYNINFATSNRSDGGIIMRGNDLLSGAADVMVCDPLTGNILMKMFSAYQTGGNYESLGYGYGPGVGEGFNKLIMIISRASGATVAANAMLYAAQLVKGKIFQIASEEFIKADSAGLKNILNSLKNKKEATSKEEIVKPAKEVVTEEILGIEIMDLEDAVFLLWENGIYAESGMGCTGPVVLVSENNLNKAKSVLSEKGMIGG